MTLLYWRIFHAIRQRARKSAAASALSQPAQRQQRTAKTSPSSAVISTAPGSPQPAEGTAKGPPPAVSSNCGRLAACEVSSAEDQVLRQNLLPAQTVTETKFNDDELCDGDIYCGTTADDTDLEQHRAPVEVNICRLDHAEAAGVKRAGTNAAYLAPSTVVVVERGMDDGTRAPVQAMSNVIPLTSAPPSPTPAVRNTERQLTVSVVTGRGTVRCGLLMEIDDDVEDVDGVSRLDAAGLDVGC